MSLLIKKISVGAGYFWGLNSFSYFLRHILQKLLLFDQIKISFISDRIKTSTRRIQIVLFD